MKINMKLSARLMATTIAATSLAFGTAQAQEAFAPTTPERLLNADAEPHNWLMANGNYSNWHYSHLDQINPGNVAGLHVVYMASIGGCSMPAAAGTRCNEASQPLVDNGIMFLNDNQNRVMAFDVRSGDRAMPLWRFDPGVETANNDRGIALYENWVIQTTADARIMAIDKQSGELVWEVGAQEPVGQPNSAEAIATRIFAGTPGVYQTAGGQQIITVGPRGAGVGYMAAYDANDGELIWRTYTIPQPGEPGNETWERPDSWRWGAAMPWGGAPAYDPETNVLYFGTGEPSPVYDPEYRPGDNLFSVSTLALDADTGDMLWYFQETPNDQWDYDSTSTRMLFPVMDAEGETHNAVSNWSRNGFFYSIDRITGNYINAVAQVDNINWTLGIDEKTGLPIEYVEGGGLQTYNVDGPRRGRLAEDAPMVCATWGGGTTGMWPASYDPTTGITYNTRTTGCTFQTITRITEEAFNPLRREGLGGATQQIQIDTQFALIAIDTMSGEVVNTWTRDQGIVGTRQAEVGALATAGGLVFTAADDGRISAVDSNTLEELWYFNAGTSIKGGIMSFAVDGRQYIAKVVGGDNPAGGGVGGLTLPTAMLVVFGL